MDCKLQLGLAPRAPLPGTCHHESRPSVLGQLSFVPAASSGGEPSCLSCTRRVEGQADLQHGLGLEAATPRCTWASSPMVSDLPQFGYEISSFPSCASELRHQDTLRRKAGPGVGESQVPRSTGGLQAGRSWPVHHGCLQAGGGARPAFSRASGLELAVCFLLMASSDAG